MADQIIPRMTGVPIRYQDMGDGTFAEVVVASGGGGGGAANDRELVSVLFRVITAFAGASVGDLVTLTQILDVDGTPATVSTIWRNQTTGADLASAPSLANLQLASGTSGSSGIAAAGKQTEISKTSAGATNIAEANANRVSLSFTNCHATVAVRVREGAPATASAGVRVLPGGTYFADTQAAISVCPESGSAECYGYEVVA